MVAQRERFVIGSTERHDCRNRSVVLGQHDDLVTQLRSLLPQRWVLPAMNGQHHDSRLSHAEVHRIRKRDNTARRVSS
jgi:hypothetical protein